MRKDKKLKIILTTLLSIVVIFTMSSYGNIGLLAKENDKDSVGAIMGDTIAEESEAQPAEDASEVPVVEDIFQAPNDEATGNELIEDNTIVTDSTQNFATRMGGIESEIASADHIIGPNGDITTNYYTLIMPGETIGVRPDWALNNKSIQGGITRFDFTVCQFNDAADNSIDRPASTPSFDDTYLTSERSKAKMKGFTPLKSTTLQVPFNERTQLDPYPNDASTHKSGPTSVSFTYLYRNDTGLPVVLNQNTTTNISNVSIIGQNDGGFTNFQGFVNYKTNPKMYFLETSYDISMDEYCIYDSYTTGPIADVFWPGKVPTKITIGHGGQKLTFPKPVLKGHLFSKIYSGSSFLNNFTDTKVETDSTIEFTYNVDTYLNTNHNNTSVITNIAKSHKVSPEFKTGYLTAEFHAQGGTINGNASYLCEIDNGHGYISIDINDYVPVKKGSEFKGWCTNPNNPVIITNTTPNVDHDWVNDEYSDNFHTDLYAVWEEKATTGTISTTGIYCSQNYPSIQAGINIQKSNPNDTVEYRWVACNNNEPDKWFEVKPWTKNNNWMSWTPEKSGGYVFVCYARVVGNEESSTIQSAFGTEFHKHIKGICQMPYTGSGGGYLIGIESYDNPNHSYQYEMLILNCNLYIQGLDAWVYDTGKCGAEENCLWTIWQPQYGYYWTLFRIYDSNGNLIDEACYGFENVY